MAAKKATISQGVVGYFTIGIIVFVLAIVIVVKMCLTIFKDGNRLLEIDKKEHLIIPVKIPAVRGNILAAGGEILATNEEWYHVKIDFWAQMISGKQESKKENQSSTVNSLRLQLPELKTSLQTELPDSLANKIISRLESGLKDFDNYQKGKTNKRNRSYWLATISYEQKKKIEQMPFFKGSRYKSGLVYQNFNDRINPYGSLALRTIGNVYTDLTKKDSVTGQIIPRDTVGKMGLERQYDELLRGKWGEGARQYIYGKSYVEPKIPAEQGKHILTTIDVHFQDIVEKMLKNKVRELGAESGTVILMEAETGAVKAITNMGRVGNDYGEIKNFAVSDMSAPGSTFKVVSMMIMLEDKVVSLDEPVDVGNGRYMLPKSQKWVEDHNASHGGYGLITAAKTIPFSSNIGVAKLVTKAYGNNPSRYVDAVHAIGFNQDMHLEIPGYGIPYIPHPKDTKRYWSPEDLFTMSYGYATQIPPIYTLSFFNAIANGGRLMKPMFVSKILEGNADGYKEKYKLVEAIQPTVINPQICSPETLSQIRQLLDSVVYSVGGTGKSLRSNLVPIAGKTGTADLHDGSGGAQASFCGYFPADNPQYSMIVVIRRPAGKASGGGMCGPVFKSIAEEIYKKNMIPSHLELPKDSLHREVKVKRLAADMPNSSGIPDVRGMGAKNAVYALENAGLRVQLQGQGTVVSQSPTPGTKIVAGQTVYLQLMK